MTERERLIRLIKSSGVFGRCGCHYNDGDRFCQDLADYLLENGIIVPPCKVGDVVYQICFGKLTEQKIIKKSKVTAIKATNKLTITLDYTTNFYDTDIGYWLFLTKEEAEKALKARGKE